MKLFVVLHGKKIPVVPTFKTRGAMPHDGEGFITVDGKYFNASEVFAEPHDPVGLTAGSVLMFWFFALLICSGEWKPSLFGAAAGLVWGTIAWLIDKKKVKRFNES